MGSLVKVDALVPGSGRARTNHNEVEHRAERLLAEYLRMWGLRDPSTIAAHCRLWARQATADSDSAAGDLAVGRASSTPFRSAVQQAMNDIDQWLDHLAGLAPANP